MPRCRCLRIIRSLINKRKAPTGAFFIYRKKLQQKTENSNSVLIHSLFFPAVHTKEGIQDSRDH
jgi:hypothetical protein